MKKLVLTTSMLFLCIFFTGCKQEKLSCTMTTSSSEELKLVETLNLTFKQNEVTHMDIISRIYITGDYTPYVEDLEKSIEQKYIDLEGKQGIEYQTDREDNMITVSINANLKKMNQESKDIMSIVNPRQSVNGAKKELEEKGYVCN